jgi:hypothetical protein
VNQPNRNNYSVLLAKSSRCGSDTTASTEDFTHFPWDRTSDSVLELLSLPEHISHPGSRNYEEPMTVFFVDALLPENRN